MLDVERRHAGRRFPHADAHQPESTSRRDTGFVAAALAESLGVTVREVLVPPDAAKLSFEDLVKWFNGRK